MNAKPHIAVALVLLCIGGAAPAALVTTVIVNDYFTGEAEVHEVKVVIDGGNLWADTTGLAAVGGQTELIYRPDLGKTWHVNHTDKTYVEIDENVALSVSDGIDTARDFFEDMAGGLFPDRVRDLEPWVRATQEMVILKGIPCTKHLVMREMEKIQEVYVTSWDEAGISSDGYSVVSGFAQSYDRVASSAGAASVLRGIERLPLEGVARIDEPAILIRHFEHGRLFFEIFINRWQDDPADDTSFELPEGYRKKMF